MNEPPTLPPITAADAEPARRLRVELTTRITTQPLHYRSGDEETAVKSVYRLFDTTRELLAAHPRAEAFETASDFLLNRVLRPCTARWHRWMVDGRFKGEQTRRQFRVELQRLQPRLIEFADFLQMLVVESVRGTDPSKAFEEFVAATPLPERLAALGGPILAGIGPEVSFTKGKLEGFATVEEINRAERKFVHARRAALGREPAGGDAEAPVENATGLSLSGGGIRSATFCLGIVQVLARQGMLPQFDYLSTVSGGGYLGAFLTSFLGTPVNPVAAGEAAFTKDKIDAAIAEAFQARDGRESAAVRHLRNNSRFLLHGGVWGRVKIVGLLVTGILTNLLLMLPIPLAAVIAVVALKVGGYWGSMWGASFFNFTQAPALWVFGILAALLGLAWFTLPVVRNCARGARPDAPAAKFRVGWEVAALILGLATVAAGLLLLLPALFHGVTTLRSYHFSPVALQKLIPSSEGAVAAVAAAAPLIFGLLAAKFKTGTARKRWTTLLFTLSGPLLYLVVFLLVGERVLSTAGAWRWVAGGTLLLGVWGWFFVDINDFSPHGYYRARLCECYLAARRRDHTGMMRALLRRVLHGREKGESVQETGVGKLRQLPLSQMNATGAAPYHLVNTAVNLPASREPNLRGRDCDFFVFSRDYCGGPVCGYVPTQTIEALDAHVDLGTAMAVSGAAASSNTGVATLRHLRFLLTLLNVRLGYWMRNPLAGPRRFWNAPGPQYLFREMTGWMHEKSGYLNLSDGGHIENLALYELLRRRCKFIVAIDAGMEPGMECADLALLQRYAEIDLGVRFDLDVADLALDDSRRTRAYAVFGKIHYSRRGGAGAGDLGWLVYLKLACTGGEPGYVGDYRRQNPDFPHQTTSDQLYDEAQFEAYRRLGECAAESLFREELAAPFFRNAPNARPGANGARFATLDDWFCALASSLLPDNDTAFDAAPRGAD